MTVNNSWKQRAIIYLSCSSLFRNVYSQLTRIPLFGAVLQSLVKLMVPIGTRLWLRIPSGLGEGLWVRLDARFEMEYASGTYEPLIAKAMLSCLGPGSVFYDVGAHIGILSMLAARIVGESGAVFAFEADPDN